MAEAGQRGGRYRRNLALFTLAALLVGALVLILALSARWAYNYSHPHRSPVAGTPSDYGLSYEPVTFSSTDGLSLAGWFIYAEGETANGAAIILCHGYGGTRDDMLPKAAILTRHGYSALLFDFRAHGESEGNVVTLAYNEVQDVQGAVTYLLTRPDVDPARIGLVGESMGGVTAIRTAARTPEIRAVVAEGAYAALADFISDNFTNLTGLPHFPFAPLMVALGEWQIGLDTDRVRPIDDIDQISPRPVFLIHGLGDAIVPPENSQRLYRAAREPKLLWQPEGVGHITAVYKRPAEFEARVIAFFDEALLSN